MKDDSAERHGATPVSPEGGGLIAAETAYRRLEVLGRLLTAAGSASVEVQGPLCCLALRAALHPLLADYRRDPLLLLNGRYISLDAQVEGLLGYVHTRRLAPYIHYRLSEEDRFVATALTPTLFSRGKEQVENLSTPRPPNAALLGATTVGEVPAALYLPFARRATACWVLAACGLHDPAPPTWPDPIPVRPVGEDTRRAARAALGAALTLLEEQGALPPTLRPMPLYFDVCAPELCEAQMEGVAGGSLGLPLALAFLSTLLQKPFPGNVGATGEVGVGVDAADTVEAVLRVEEKARALRAALPWALLLAPARRAAQDDCSPTREEGIVRVCSVTEAARNCGLLPSGKGGISPEDPAPEGPPVKAFTISPGGSETREVSYPSYLVTDFVPGTAGKSSGMFAAPDEKGLEGETYRICRRALERSGGRVFTAVRTCESKEEGVLCAEFLDAQAACAAALDLQHSLLCHLWPDGVTAGPALRIGIQGEPFPVTEEGKLDTQRGLTFSPAARLMEAGSPGQVLVTGDIYERVRNDKARSVEWRWKTLGAYRLRDLAPPRSLFQLSRDGLPVLFPPPRSMDTHRHNMPVYLETFVGREREVATLACLLLEPAVRLVTLTGGGGVGKTRLSLETAARCVDHFPDGVWHVPLQEGMQQSSEEVASAVLGALRLAPDNEGQRQSAVRWAITALRSRRALLVFEGGEGPLAGAGFIEQLLAHCPQVVCLVAARARLAVAGETVFPVPPLAAKAVELFCVRARAHHGGEYTVPPGQQAVLESICHRLGGLPLTLELAAAQTRYLSLPEILSPLEGANAPSVEPPAVAVQGATALSDTLSRTYALLSEEERLFLSYLSVFSGGSGFTPEAARCLLAALREGSGNSCTAALGDALDLITSLEGHALVQQRRRGSGERVRFILHDAVRESARRYLRTAAGESGECRALRAQAAYCQGLAREAERAVYRDSAEVSEVFAVMDDEMPNLRLAWRYLCDHDPDRVPEYVVCLADYLRRAGYVRELESWTKTAMALMEQEITAVSPAWLRRRLYRIRAQTYRDTSEVEQAVTLLGAAFDLKEQENEPAPLEPHSVLLPIWGGGEEARELAEMWNLSGLLECQRQCFDAAVAAHEKSRDYAQIARIRRYEVRSLNNLGLTAYRRGDTSVAHSYYQEAYHLATRIDDTRGRAYAVNNIGFLAFERGDLEEARRRFTEFFHLSRQHREAYDVGAALLNLGDVLNQMGKPEGAFPLVVLAEQILLRLGHDCAQEATRCLSEVEAIMGEERTGALRQEMMRRSLEDLLQMDPLFSDLTLTINPDTPEPREGEPDTLRWSRSLLY